MYANAPTVMDLLSNMEKLRGLRLGNLGTEANTQKTQMETNLMPKGMDIKTLEALINAGKYNLDLFKAGPAAFDQWFKNQPEAVKADWIAQHPKEWAQMSNNAAAVGAGGIQAMPGFPGISASGGFNNPYQPAINDLLSRLTSPNAAVREQAQMQANTGQIPAANQQQLTPEQQSLLGDMQKQQQAYQEQLARQGAAQAETAKDVKAKNLYTAEEQIKQRYGENALKTIAGMDSFSDAAFSFAGREPAKFLEALKSNSKNQNPEYQKARVFFNNAKLLGDQLTKYYGASITPEKQKEIQEFVTPKFWIDNPEMAKQRYETFKELLNSEVETMAARPSQILNPSYNKEKQQETKKRVMNAYEKASTPKGTVMVIAPDGRRGTIPEANLNAALKAGYRKA